MVKLFKNKRLFRLSETDSTNNYLSKIAHELPEGSIVYTYNQTQGRGLGNNRWESEPNKNLSFSLLLQPTFLKAHEQFYLLKCIALAVADFISAYTDKVAIKWPNDIYLNDKKVAGILIENSIERDFIKQSIIGVGININQTKFPENLPNPVSLAQCTHSEYNLDLLLEEIINIIEIQYERLSKRNFESLDKDYLGKLYLFNQMAKYIADDIPFTGTITGVEPTGELIIEDTNGNLREFLFKEVEYVI